MDLKLLCTCRAAGRGVGGWVKVVAREMSPVIPPAEGRFGIWTARVEWVRCTITF